MIESAAADFEIEMENSWMIGDKKIDIETGIAAGVATALVLTGYGTEHRSNLATQPDLIAVDLGEAVKRICLTSAKIVL
jgi:D-glycero-D-manno-heptose 1,7-bisphosphate phosphatase